MKKITTEKGVIQTEKGSTPIELTECKQDIKKLADKLNMDPDTLNEILMNHLLMGQHGQNFPSPDIFDKPSKGN